METQSQNRSLYSLNVVIFSDSPVQKGGRECKKEKRHLGLPNASSDEEEKEEEDIKGEKEEEQEEEENEEEEEEEDPVEGEGDAESSSTDIDSDDLFDDEDEVKQCW